MSWKEIETKTGKTVSLNGDKLQKLEDEKRVSAPVLQKEAENNKPFQPVHFQEIRGTGIFEAEFGVKGRDLIFHFWPDGYHHGERSGTTHPDFKKGFKANLQKALEDEFGKGRTSVESDPDMGAMFAKAFGVSDDLFLRKRAIQVCTELYKSLGGTP